jgi:SAM-dependent methyltransferase
MDSAERRIGSFWEENPNAAQESQWTSDPYIGAAVYRRMTLDEGNGHWLDWLFNRHFAGRDFGRILSIGCGVGDHEIAMARFRPEAFIEAFDFSNASIDIARQKASEAGLTNVDFFQGNFNEINVEPTTYDMILCSGSLHHVRELEHLLGEVRRGLTTGGCFIVNEYVGDCYNIYGADQVRIIQQVLDGLPPSLRMAERFRVGTIEEVFDRDPTEAVRSKLIPQFLRIYFREVDERPFGGALLHPLYPFLNVARLETDPDCHQAIINGFITLDGHLLEQGKSDFSFFICS